MWTTFRNSLGKSRGAILGWGLGLFAFTMLFLPVYDSMAANAEQLNELLALYPEEMMVFFGDFASFATPEGFLTVEYFSFMPIVLGIFALLAGSGMIAADEEDGTLDLIAAYPVSRSGLFWGRALAVLVSTTLIIILAYLGILIPAKVIGIELSAAALLTPMASLYAVLLVLSAIGLLLSMLLPSRRMAAMLTGILVVGDFFIQGLSQLNDALEPLAKILPLHYYQVDNWIEGINANWLFGLLGAALLFTLAAWWRFLRRDIRVAGEGGWQLPGLPFGRRKEAAEATGD